MQRRVVITGIGMLTPLGNTTQDTWEGLVNGQSGIDFIKSFDTSNFECKYGGELKNFNEEDYMSEKQIRRLDRSSILAIAASKQAIQDAGLDTPFENEERTGIALGTGIGGAHLLIENYVREDSKILDFGCGNGGFLKSLKKGKKFGIELNLEMLKILNTENYNGAYADMC